MTTEIRFRFGNASRHIFVIVCVLLRRRDGLVCGNSLLWRQLHVASRFDKEEDEMIDDR